MRRNGALIELYEVLVLWCDLACMVVLPVGGNYQAVTPMVSKDDKTYLLRNLQHRASQADRKRTLPMEVCAYLAWACQYRP